MHYLIKETADETCKAQLAFMEERLSKLPQYQEDRKKLREFQEQKGCDACLPPKRRGGKTGDDGRRGKSEDQKK
jgi:hypothetical protein